MGTFEYTSCISCGTVFKIIFLYAVISDIQDRLKMQALQIKLVVISECCLAFLFTFNTETTPPSAGGKVYFQSSLFEQQSFQQALYDPHYSLTARFNREKV